ncbi:MAG: hypothetical protein ACKVP4_02475 [Hyphomicrobium sp.]
MLTHFIRKAIGDCVKDRTGVRAAAAGDRVPEENLGAAIGWLMKSIEACDGHASSKGYRFMKGWMPPYPETSGYIIPTLLALERQRKDGTFADTASAIGIWLTQIQRPDGGFSGGELGLQTEPDVFDTGMILLGFNALIKRGDHDHFLRPGRMAAEFLVGSMDDSGCFVRNMSHNIVHAYNVRAAWALMAYGSLTDDRQLIDRAADCAMWTIAQQNEHGFYLKNNFKPGGNANTHGTAYVMRGLLQIHYLTADERILSSVCRAADKVCELYERRSWIAAELGPQWEYLSSHICLTGYAQLSIVLYRLFVVTRKPHYRNTADRLLEAVARLQSLDAPGAPWHGAIAGSFPIYGRYAPLQYPNWATKFFIDAILAQRAVAEGVTDWPSIDRDAG